MDDLVDNQQEEQVSNDVVAEEISQPVHEDEVVIQVGDEEAPTSHEKEEAPEWVKELRRKNRELSKRNRELELNSQKPQEVKPVLRQKPTLEGCDYDTERLEKELESWFSEKTTHEQSLKKIEDEAKAQNEDFQSKVATYNETKSKLKVANFDDLEEDAIKHLTVIQQGILIQGAKNPAVLVAALGANGGKLAAELSTIKDPVKFAFAAAELETKLKVTTRKPPQPETTLKSGSPASAVNDLHLTKLEEEAERTGDRTKVIQYKRSLKK